MGGKGLNYFVILFPSFYKIRVSQDFSSILVFTVTLTNKKYLPIEHFFLKIGPNCPI